MYKINDLLGREVFNQDTGDKLASVEEVIFDDTRRAVALHVDDGLLQSPRVLRWSSVGNVADEERGRERRMDEISTYAGRESGEAR